MTNPIPDEPDVADLPDSPSEAFRLGWRMGWTADRWLPIESAPRDGTEFLAWFPADTSFGEMTITCWWHSVKGREFEECWRTPLFTIGEEADDAPTHWQPLSAPPGSAEA